MLYLAPASQASTRPSSRLRLRANKAALPAEEGAAPQQWEALPISVKAGLKWICMKRLPAFKGKVKHLLQSIGGVQATFVDSVVHSCREESKGGHLGALPPSYIWSSFKIEEVK